MPWMARASGHRGRSEVVFSSPKGDIYRAASGRGHDFGKIEVYIRRLGQPDAGAYRQPGYRIRVPEKHRTYNGWLNRGDGEERLFRFLEIFDPAGRNVLLEFRDEPPESLYRQMLEDLFEEYEEERSNGKEQARQLHGCSASERNGANGGGRQPEKRPQEVQALQSQGLEGWLERQGLLAG